MVVALFGSIGGRPFGDSDGFISAVRNDLGEAARLVRHRDVADVGIFGSASRRSYTFLVPRFLDVVAALQQVPAGHVQTL
jgi:hypothetical protein